MCLKSFSFCIFDDRPAPPPATLLHVVPLTDRLNQPTQTPDPRTQKSGSNRPLSQLWRRARSACTAVSARGKRSWRPARECRPIDVSAEGRKPEQRRWWQIRGEFVIADFASGERRSVLEKTNYTVDGGRIGRFGRTTGRVFTSDFFDEPIAGQIIHQTLHSGAAGARHDLVLRQC